MECIMREGVYQKIFICITRKRDLFILYVLHHEAGGGQKTIKRITVLLDFIKFKKGDFVLHQGHRKRRFRYLNKTKKSMQLHQRRIRFY